MQSEVQNNTVEEQQGSGTLVKKEYTLIELATDFAAIEKTIKDSGEDVPDHLIQLHTVAKGLLEGRIDDVADLRLKIEGGIGACEKMIQAYEDQISNANVMLKRIDEFTKQAMDKLEKKKIDGTAWRVSVRKNPASLIVLEEGVIPDKFKTVDFVYKKKFSYGDRGMALFCQGLALNRVVDDANPLTEEERKKIEGMFDVKVSKADIKKAMTSGETVAGCSLEAGFSINYEPGKANVVKV